MVFDLNYLFSKHCKNSFEGWYALIPNSDLVALNGNWICFLMAKWSCPPNKIGVDAKMIFLTLFHYFLKISTFGS